MVKCRRMPTVDYPHIRFGADGVAHLGTSRYTVLHLAGEHYYYGWTAEELLRQHTDLRPEEIYAALGFFYDHYDEMVEKLRETAERADDHRRQSSHSQLSRAELLARQKNAV